MDENYNDALRCFSGAIGADPDTAAYYLHRSATLIRLKNYEQALRDAVEGERLATTNPTAHLRKGVAYLNMGRLRDAKACFRTAELSGLASTSSAHRPAWDGASR